jgi:hypothetical protein
VQKLHTVKRIVKLKNVRYGFLEVISICWSMSFDIVRVIRIVYSKRGKVMKKTLIGCSLVLLLVGCGTKTANYTFNQTTAGEHVPKVAAFGSASNPTSQDTGRSSTNSGGSGNTIIIIESSAQDAKSDPDLSGMADAVVDKLTGGLTDVTDVVEDLTDQGNVVEVE